MGGMGVGRVAALLIGLLLVASLVVHGAGGGFDQGLDALEPLVGEGLQLIAMSRFSYLRTPLPSDASAAAQADAHACLLDALERIGAPSLVISLEDDMFGTYDAARYSAEQIPGARFIGYSRGGHLWVGHHAAVMSEMADFLRSHGESR